MRHLRFQPAIYSVAIFGAVAASVSTHAAPIVPTVSPAIQAAAQTIHADPLMQRILQELISPQAQKERFNNLVELARIASPSRYELRRQAEISKRLINDWGFAPTDIPTTSSGFLPHAGVQKVDGLPVYNVCAVIPGLYRNNPNKVTFNGQGPKVLMEGHIDTVNPATLPPAASAYEPVKLQNANEPIVKTRAELAAIPDELHFDAHGKVIEDNNYRKAYRRYQNLKDAQKANGVRIYVPGYSDAMINTVAVMQAARILKKYGLTPIYDIWICGTAGEEGKGNLCGMKQLYGYSQDAGKGNNALNFVGNFAADSTSPGSGTVNYLGSYRFEIQYIEPEGFRIGDKPRPSALSAMSRAIDAIANIKTPYDLDKKAERTTYSVGVAECSPAAQGARSTHCTVMVDMRSPTQGPLAAIRSKIEPEFQKALDAENNAYGLSDEDPHAVQMKLVWFGDRPASQRTRYDDIAVAAWWEASKVADIDVLTQMKTNSYSLNDNVPAAVGVPTINMNVGTTAAAGGGHTWYEWGIPGDGAAEGKRLYRMILATLIASGYKTSTGKIVEPNVAPLGHRTTEEIFP